MIRVAPIPASRADRGGPADRGAVAVGGAPSAIRRTACRTCSPVTSTIRSCWPSCRRWCGWRGRSSLSRSWSRSSPRCAAPPCRPGSRGLAAQQGLARALVNGVLLLLPVTVATVAPAGQALAMTATRPPRPPRPPTRSPPRRAAGGASDRRPRRGPPPRTVTVTDGGARTWWDLAAAHLGDGAAWRQLWYLNRGRVQADGSVLTSQRTMLRPGSGDHRRAGGGDRQ